MLGMVCILIATFCFSSTNAIIRALSSDLPPVEISFFRSIFGVLLQLPFVAWFGLKSLKTARPQLHLARGVLHAISMILWFVALSMVPLAETAALEFAAPIMSTSIAILFLGEVARTRRLVALAVGIIGVFIVVRPGFDVVSWGQIIVLVSVALWAGCQLIIREVSRTDSAIFANLVLADEINRAPSKVQSALLEAMQERQVTIGDQTWPLPKPFLVLATQNPIEQEGTYPLPEAQMDRFMLKVIVGYPSAAEELVILDRMASTTPNLSLNAIVSPEEILGYQALVNQIHVDQLVKDYVVRLVIATREAAAGKGVAPELKRLVRIGASPRATINLTLAARACALLEGRDHVTPDDIKLIGPDVLRHRVLLTYEAEAEEVSTESIVMTLLGKVKVP